MRLILIGPPGSGKGTQAKLLAERRGLIHIGTGDILREAIRLQSPAGRLAEPYVNSGKLVPDELVNEIVADRFRRDDRPESFVMDGYPRTLAQAETFDEVLHQQGLKLDAVVALLVDDEETVRRLSGRRVCPKCGATYHLANKPPRKANRCDVCGSQLIQRDDDQETTVRERLKLYHANTGKLLPYYRAQGQVRSVDGEGDIEPVFQRVISAIDEVDPLC
jgi:adenylate kinase